MEVVETDIRSRLLEESTEFRRLADKHRQFEARIRELSEKRPCTELERLEQIELKKRKLLLKDQMATMIRGYAQQQTAATTG